MRRRFGPQPGQLPARQLARRNDRQPDGLRQVVAALSKVESSGGRVCVMFDTRWTFILGLQGRQDDPQRLQQEMFKLYKEHNVNPLGGCWPMLLPWPVLLALFFVFQNTIELRGESFLWMPDLSRADPYFITPILMGLSMFGLMKLGQRGMAANPQMKMMLYVMPPVMTFMFGQFASGLNLYYFISNLASIPQQWMLTNERLRRNPPTPRTPAPKGGKRK